MALEILKISQDGLTGHISAQIRVVDRALDGTVTQGAVETVGIDHGSLTKKFDCPHEAGPEQVTAAIENWLKGHYVGAMARKKARDSRAGVVAGLAGKTLEFEEPQ